VIVAEGMDANDVRDHYDDLDWIYREIWGAHVHHGYWLTGRETAEAAVEALVDRVAASLKLQVGQRICDIGCGYGASANYMAENNGVAVTGLTISPAQAAIARGFTTTRGSFTCHCRDWLHNALPDQAFDGAYAIESTEHMVDKAAFFREASRTVRGGGRLVVCAWLADARASPVAIRHLLQPICREGRLPGMGTREEYEQMAGDAGFALVSYEDLSRNVRRTWSICARRILWKIFSDSRYRRLLTDPAFKNRVFLLSIPRLAIALHSGAMRYGLFTWQRTAEA